MIKKQTIKIIKKVIFIAATSYIMIGSILYFIQEKIMFFPTTLNQNYIYNFKETHQEIFLKTTDGAVINAVKFSSKNPKGVILYFHGNSGDISRWGEMMPFFIAKQYDVLLMDYRTYGKSTGKLSEKAFYNDAQLCYDYLLKTYAEDKINVYGRSLGTGIATQLASLNNPKQLILETPYYSILDVAQHRFPMFPMAKLLKYKFSSFEYIKNVSCPITIFHGTDDTVVPFSSGEKLYKSSVQKKIEMIVIPKGEHNNLIEFDGYLEGINTIL